MAPLDELDPQLRVWLPKQRWFQGKDRSLLRAHVADAAVLGERLLLVICEVGYGDHPPDSYLVPLAPAEDGPLVFDGQRWQDAVADADAARLLADMTCAALRTPTAAGASVVGAPVSGRQPDPGLAVRPLRAEQSNSSVVLGEELILKVLRRLEPGIHPDIELTAVLTEEEFPHVPAQHGSLQLDRAGEATALAVLSSFVPGSHEGWALATAEASGVRHGLLDRLPALGEAVAALHLTLERALGARAGGAQDAAAWSKAMLAQLDRVLGTAGRVDPAGTAQVRARADDLRGVFESVRAWGDVGPLVRIHGDLHLGQVLLGPDERWLLLDFEGEPVRLLAERRARSTPLRDVAGMLRSFDYAAAEPLGGEVTAEAAAWRDRARGRFLEGYLGRAGALLPAGEAASALLAAWELDKAVYELGYELANRPDWVPIPAGGIIRLLD